MKRDTQKQDSLLLPNFRI